MGSGSKECLDQNGNRARRAHLTFAIRLSGKPTGLQVSEERAAGSHAPVSKLYQCLKTHVHVSTRVRGQEVFPVPPARQGLSFAYRYTGGEGWCWAGAGRGSLPGPATARWTQSLLASPGTAASGEQERGRDRVSPTESCSPSTSHRPAVAPGTEGAAACQQQGRAGRWLLPRVRCANSSLLTLGVRVSKCFRWQAAGT